MTQAAALYDFFSQFGIPAYPAEHVPIDAVPPYLTYENSTSFFEDGAVLIAVNLYYRGTEEKPINDKVNEIATVIKRGGCVVRFDLGYMWIRRGTPFSQSMADADSDIKRRYLNISIEYFA